MRPGHPPQPVRRAATRPERFLDDVEFSDYEVAARGGPREPCPDISVVVPTRNRRELLAEALSALMRQDVPEGGYEVIVVDNASDDGTRTVLENTACHGAVAFTGIVSRYDRGPAASRNAGVRFARGRIVAFTDSDCVPTPGWLRAVSAAFAEDAGVGAVQGRTIAQPEQPQPLFNHFIETLAFDGSYSTSNVAYRRDAVAQVGGFDGRCAYWEDVDLGWRVHRAGWRSTFASEALVYHQVMRLSALGWLRNAWHYHIWPAKAARYHEFGDYLVGNLWAADHHPLFDAFVVGLVLTPWRRACVALTLPYLAFAARTRWVGRWPLLRVALHMARDGLSLVALLSGSLRFRRLVL